MSTQEIQAERDAQLSRWDHAADDAWSTGEWAALIVHYTTRRVFKDLHSVDLKAFRADMVKVGALALACIEATDRKARFYEDR